MEKERTQAQHASHATAAWPESAPWQDREISAAVLAEAPPPSLWHNSEFLRLWFAQAVSKAGTAVTEVALPLTAVLVLNATPGQMAALVIAGQLPNCPADMGTH